MSSISGWCRHKKLIIGTALQTNFRSYFFTKCRSIFFSFRDILIGTFQFIFIYCLVEKVVSVIKMYTIMHSL